MKTILVSACLLGDRVRYDGKVLPVDNKILKKWIADGQVVPICPEVAGGLLVPRTPAEIVGGDGNAVLSGEARVVDSSGKDVTAEFVAGAQHALSICHQQGISVAVLPESSPSCGSNTIYDGQFSGTKIPGVGVTTALLRKHGISVYGQHQIPEAAENDHVAGG